uniref:Nanos-type domain-containing protein n=1 Tax=Angiostrongylus cantonensis TaxID=6313 RepID=A0A0K0D5L9_ANGCA
MIQNPQVEIRGREQFGPELKPPKENIPLLERERYCLYCYEKHTEMCVFEGRIPPSLNSGGIWRGHCMTDENGITTCPLLWFTKCCHCGATAEAAHPDKLCPKFMLGNLRLENT